MSSETSSISGLEPFWPRGIKTHGCNVLVSRTPYTPFPVRRQPLHSYPGAEDLSSTDIGIGDQCRTGAAASDTATRSWRRTASSAAAAHFKFRFELLHPTGGHVTKSRSPSPTPDKGTTSTTTTTTSTMQSLSPFSVATSSEGDHITIPDANRSKRRPSYLLQKLFGRHNSKDRDSKENHGGSTGPSSPASSIHSVSEAQGQDSPPPVPPKYALLPRKIIPHIASFSTEDLRQFTSGPEFGGKPYLHDEDSTSDGTSTLLSASMSSLASGTTLAFTESSPCDPKTCACGTSPSSACSSVGKFPLATRGSGAATHQRTGSGNSGHATPTATAQSVVYVSPAPSVAASQRRMTRVSLVSPRRAPPPSPISAQFAPYLVLPPTSVPSTPSATAQSQPQMVISPATSRAASPSPLPLSSSQAQTQTQSPLHSTSSGSQTQTLHPRTALAMDLSRPIVTKLEDLNVTNKLSMKIQQGPISPTLPTSSLEDDSDSSPPTVPPKPHLKPKSKSTPPSAQHEPTLSPDELQAMLDRFSFTIQDDDAPSAPQASTLPHSHSHSHSQSSTSISTMVPLSGGSLYGHSTPARSATPTMFNSTTTLTATAAMTTTTAGGLIASPTPVLAPPTVCHTPLSPPPWHRRAAASPSPSSKESSSYKHGRRSESPSKYTRSTPSSRKGSLSNGSDASNPSPASPAQVVMQKGRHRSGSQSLSTIPLSSFSLGMGPSRHAREPAISPSASKALALLAQETPL